MKRRRFVQSLVAAPAASALLAQQITPAPGIPANTPRGVPQNPTRGNQPPGSASQDLPHFEASVPDMGADPMPHFFTPAQFEALRHLSGILMPAGDGRPGAIEARAPEFLDFLVSDSPEDRQQMYRQGLDALNVESNKRFHRNFSDTTAEQAALVLSPLNQPWQYNPPADPLAAFLLAAKADVRAATVNSRAYVTASSGGGRRFGGSGLYWYSLD